MRYQCNQRLIQPASVLSKPDLDLLLPFLANLRYLPERFPNVILEAGVVLNETAIHPDICDVVLLQFVHGDHGRAERNSGQSCCPLSDRIDKHLHCDTVFCRWGVDAEFALQYLSRVGCVSVA